MPDTRSPISRTEIAMRVRGIIAEEVPGLGNSWPESATLDNLELDELDRLVVLMNVEESFDIDLLDVEKLSSAEFGAMPVGAFIDLVEGQVRCIA